MSVALVPSTTIPTNALPMFSLACLYKVVPIIGYKSRHGQLQAALDHKIVLDLEAEHSAEAKSYAAL